MVDATVTLYKDIGLDSNYNRTMLFDTKAQQNNWFNSISTTLKLTLTNVNYNKIQNAIYVHEQFGDIYGYTYCRLQDIDDSGRTYYGFISGVTLVDDETTRFDIVLDPIQTFMTEWELGECMVAREHVDRWGSGTYPTYISPLKEGAVGNSVVNDDNEIVQYVRYLHDPSTPVSVPIVTFVVVFTADRGSGDDAITRVMYGLIPFSPGTNYTISTQFNYTDESGVTHEVENVKQITPEDVINGSWCDKLQINPEAVIGAYICNPFSIDYLGTQDGNTVVGGYGGIPSVTINSDGSIPEDEPIPYYIIGNIFQSPYVIQVLTEDQIQEAFSNYINFTLSVDRPTKPLSAIDTASDTHEPQLYMSPFRIDYITDGVYTPIITIPDQVKLSGAITLNISNLVKTSGITDYFTIETPENGILGASAMVPANTADILSDAWRSYCLTQRDSDRRMMWNNIISNTINNTVFMGYGGALVGSRSASGDWDDDDRRNSLLSRGVIGATTMAVGASLITSAVQGYQMWVQQEAKEQTIRNQPSTLTAQSDGVAVGFSNMRHISVKMDEVDYQSAYDKFRKYGYMVNRMETPNIKSRYYFNYICTTYTTVKGALPADIKQSLVSIFEKGITFFHADNCDDTNYPTNTSGEELENIERSLL